MRFSLPSFLCVSAALAAVGVFSGCSGGAGSPGAVPAQQQIVGQSKIKPDNFFNRLYVADGSAQIVVLDNTYTWLSNISGNTPCPSGEWVTRTGAARLYVANFGCNGIPEVTEFKQLGVPPAYGAFQFSYNAGLSDPLFVTTDNAAHVYAGDYLGQKVVEYAQLSNAVLQQCSGGFMSGVAVDASGDVFVSEQSPTQIIEYPGPAGLSNCGAGAPIPATLPSGFAGGELLLDNSNNLIACDQSSGVYKIAAPSYSSTVLIPTTASFKCLHMSLNGPGNHLFITEPFSGPPDIQVIKYPSGVVLPPILPGAGNHYIRPIGVAAFPG